MLMQEERELVVEYGKKMSAAGLSTGTSGNISIYNAEKGLVAISPSGMDYFSTTPEDVVILDLDGKYSCWNLSISSCIFSWLFLYFCWISLIIGVNTDILAMDFCCLIISGSMSSLMITVKTIIVTAKFGII